MRIRPGILIAIVSIFAVLIGGRFLGRFGSKPAEVAVNTQPADPGVGNVRPPAPETEPPAPRPMGRILPGTARQPGVALAPPVTPMVPVAPPAGALITDWEERIDDLLTSKDDENLKAKHLLSIFHNLPEEGQIEAAQHLSNLLADEDYAALKPTLTNATVSAEVLDVLMTDVLNRPNQIKLESLLEVARVPNHPNAEEAIDVLEVFVDENYGTDWVAWEAAVKKWLKENPDE